MAGRGVERERWGHVRGWEGGQLDGSGWRGVDRHKTFVYVWGGGGKVCSVGKRKAAFRERKERVRVLMSLCEIGRASCRERV